MTNYRKYRKLLLSAILAVSCLIPLAKAEGLRGHAESIEVRL